MQGAAGAALYIGLYVIYAIPLFIIAVKSEHPLAWLAFIPIANIWLMCDMVDGCVLVLLLLIPIAGGVLFQAIVWWRLAENTNKPGWLGILMVFPIIDLFVGYYIACVDTGRMIA